MVNGVGSTSGLLSSSRFPSSDPGARGHHGREPSTATIWCRLRYRQCLATLLLGRPGSISARRQCLASRGPATPVLPWRMALTPTSNGVGPARSSFIYVIALAENATQVGGVEQLTGGWPAARRLAGRVHCHQPDPRQPRGLRRYRRRIRHR
jgi:hypothetical protein